MCTVSEIILQYWKERIKATAGGVLNKYLKAYNDEKLYILLLLHIYYYYDETFLNVSKIPMWLDFSELSKSSLKEIICIFFIDLIVHRIE